MILQNNNSNNNSYQKLNEEKMDFKSNDIKGSIMYRLTNSGTTIGGVGAGGGGGTPAPNNHVFLMPTIIPSSMLHNDIKLAHIAAQNRLQAKSNGGMMETKPLLAAPKPQQQPQAVSIRTCISSQNVKSTNRLKCREFNDLLMCFICQGYLINPTTITNDNCFHTFCRSCIVNIVTELGDRSYCPKCGKGSKPVRLANLKSDETLKSIVYKLMPSLHHKELKRCLAFNTDKNLTKTQDLRDLEEEEFFAPTDPISLSLEYHPKALGTTIPNDQIPPVRYLQCPAAVTMHHLKRFLCTKCDINPDDQRVDIEIIYDDEILASDFSLMDVAYFFKWKRTAPMRLYYQVLVYNITNSNHSANERSNDCDTNIEAIYNCKTNEAVAKKTVKFKNVGSEVHHPTIVEQQTQLPTGLNRFGSNVAATKCKLNNSSKDKRFNFVETESTSDKNNHKHSNKNIINAGKDYMNNNSIYTTDNNVSVTTSNGVRGDKEKKPMTNNSALDKSLQYTLKSSANESSSANVNASFDADSYKINRHEAAAAAQQYHSDFKSLRSNNDFHQSSSNSGGSTGSSPTKSKSGSPKSSHKDKSNRSPTQLSSAAVVESNQKSVSKLDIVVCIPQNHIHRASNSSDDSFENLSLAQLKTANKKCSSISPRILESTDQFENEHYDVYQKVVIKKEKSSSGGDKTNGKVHSSGNKESLKLKIDKSSLKHKHSSSTGKSTKSSERSESKRLNKERKFSSEESLPITNDVDLTTYAKVIGLKPIKPIQDEKRDSIVKQSPDASPASATSSSCSSSGSFNFSSEVTSSSSHKKRKKAKHSKEAKELKKRKLHAEIASEPVSQPEGIKLKVKITPSHKSHKSEKKLNGSESKIIAEHHSLQVVSGSDKPKSIVAASEEPSSTSTLKSPHSIVDSVQNESKKLLENVALKSETVSSPSVEAAAPAPAPSKSNDVKSVAKVNDVLEEKAKPIAEQYIAKPYQFVNSNKPKKQNFIPKTIATNSNPKFAAAVAAAAAAASLPNPFNKTAQKTSSSTVKLAPPKLQANITESKITQSPPLPPSLFKTTPLSTAIAKVPTTTPLPTNGKNLPLTNRPSMSQHQQMAMSQMNRITNKNSPSRSGTAANFIVPNPPRGIVSNAAKHFPIGSIASQQHRQAAQLKRSASLDSSPLTYAKQLKLEQDRLIRKGAYTQQNQQQQQNMLLPVVTSQQILNRNSPTAVVFSSVQQIKNQPDQIYYTSAMGSAYTHENMTKKPVPILLPPSSISVTKMVDTFPNSIITSPSGLTITPQDQQPPAFQFQNSNKPALEIVRIQSNIPPIDQQQFSIINNNTIKQTTKASRPPPPPIPLKIKKPLAASQPSMSKIASATPQNAQLLSINQVASIKTENTGQSKAAEILDLSGKSRSPSREKSASPRDACSPEMEAAIHQMFQQQNHVTSSSSNMPNHATSFKAAPTEQKPALDDSNGLQNLQMLSESALNREKLAVKTNRAVPMLSKLDVGKIRANANVRQQNASIRNIPNPSALAFRGSQQPPVPMLANITKTGSPTSAASPQPSTESIPKTQALTSNVKPMSPTTTTAATSGATDSSKVIASKKNLEQLAQNLNIRAAAAADNCAKNSAASPKAGSSPSSSHGSNPNSSSVGSLVTSTTTDSKANSSVSSSTSPSSAMAANAV